jgi:hypothetical protein
MTMPSRPEAELALPDTTARRAAWLDYPLVRALRERRSRRFALGMHMPGGPFAHRSTQVPVPLSEEEEAILAFAACGISGPSLGDWDYGAGGNMMAGLVGRTIGSADGVQTAALFVIRDDATYLARRPRELDPATLEEVIRLTHAGDFVAAWRLLRVPVAGERRAPVPAPPGNISANRWQLFAPGTTYFLPVADLSLLLINVLLEVLNEESALYPIDERNFFRPAGVARWGRSRGGHLDDSARGGRTPPIMFAERLVGEMVAVEMGMALQNLGLVCDALGLGGTPTFAGDDEEWFRALGFRMGCMPASRMLGLARPLRLAMRLKGDDVPMGYPLGLDGESGPLLHAYCPPYFPTMADAVRAVVAAKLGANGVLRRGSAAWRAGAAAGAAIPPISERAIEATIAYCEYVWQRYGRFPATYPAFHVLMGFQAHHVDCDFYDRHFAPGALSQRHRQHIETWHGDGPTVISVP